ncbi:hypothetical protein ACIHCQ_32560 [Streptomyces sp. NPDC052236]|uniref:hypothetical protein n=1 Tax=Streptomyces sp. NPDC052236 TaxID=3365686 RepID=UPI0037CE0B8F
MSGTDRLKVLDELATAAWTAVPAVVLNPAVPYAPMSRAQWFGAWKQVAVAVDAFRSDRDQLDGVLANAGKIAAKARQQNAQAKVRQSKAQAKGEDVPVPESLIAELSAAEVAVTKAQDEYDDLLRDARTDVVAQINAGPALITVTRDGWLVVGALGIDAAKYDALAARLDGEQAVLGAPTPLAAISTQVGRIRGIVDGARPAGATEAEVAIAATWFGAEVVRSPRAAAQSTMVLELMDAGHLAASGDQPADPKAALDWPAAAMMREPEVGTTKAARDLWWTGWAVAIGAAQNLPGRFRGRVPDWGGYHPMAHRNSDEEVRQPVAGLHAGSVFNVVQVKEMQLLEDYVALHAVAATTDLEIRAMTAPLITATFG